MTPEERATSRKRCDEATPGPWEHSKLYQNGGVIHGISADIEENGRIFPHQCIASSMLANDAEFAAHARTDLPAALNDLEEADRRIAGLVSEVKAWTISFLSQERQLIESREKFGAASIHQQETDARVIKQREEIKRQAEEIARQNKRLLNFDRWKRECEQWKDEDSVFWKISELEKKLAVAELAMAQVRAARPELSHTLKCKSRECFCSVCHVCVDEHPSFFKRGNARYTIDPSICPDFEWVDYPCDCILSHIPTGPDSPLVEAVKRLVVVWMNVWNEGVASSADETEAIRNLVALAPESWKQPEGRKE